MYLLFEPPTIVSVANVMLKHENACTLRYMTSIIPNRVLDFHRLYPQDGRKNGTSVKM